MPDSDDDPDSPAALKARCAALQAQLDAAEADIRDFTDSSHDLQRELEHELERMERAETALRTDLDQHRSAADEWKTKYTTALRDHTATMSHMQRELETLRTAEKALRAQLRDMELDNDDLEKSERAKDSSLQDLDARFNKALERIALLEEELVAKAQLDEEVQRLKDELRDVNEELGITRAQLAAAPAPSSRAPSPLAPSSSSAPDSPTASTAPTTVAGDGDDPTATPPSHRPSTPPTDSPSISLTNPTPLPASRALSPSPSPSPSKIARRPPSRASGMAAPSPAAFKAPLSSAGAAAVLARSTRTAQLSSRGGLTSSPSTPTLSSSSSPTKRPSRLPQSPSLRTFSSSRPAPAAIPRSDTATMIRDMQHLTCRARALTHRLDARRASAIPRSTILASSPPPPPQVGGMARSATAAEPPRRREGVDAPLFARRAARFDRRFGFRAAGEPGGRCGRASCLGGGGEGGVASSAHAPAAAAGPGPELPVAVADADGLGSSSPGAGAGGTDVVAPCVVARAEYRPHDVFRGRRSAPSHFLLVFNFKLHGGGGGGGVRLARPLALGRGTNSQQRRYRGGAKKRLERFCLCILAEHGGQEQGRGRARDALASS
ncbi:hypothetical protein Rhopal_002408-T1 [Rhodotorula paludigena]|uniref:NUDE domain-containing protein n=1 Tax=Rhodotorula paludigena TaxID=86838 RepID=A0AAV5GGT9_9BASI|nr:hypothetical protein Rhopal_002408-T1 [Rhodotorula paludigena]